MRALFLAWSAAILLWAWAPATSAQTTTEPRAFSAAVQEFEDGSYALSEKEMAEFLRKFPESARIPEAILYQARAAIEQQKFTVGVELLRTNTTLAGPLADQYRYWLATAYLQSTNYQAAEETFAALIKDFPHSPQLLAASYGEALVHFRLRDWARAIDLLRQPNGAFRREALLRPTDELTMRGALLLAEALLERKEYRAAEEVLARVSENDLIPELKWHRQYVLCRVQLGDQRLRPALASTTNLLALATASGKRNLLAESAALQGDILEQLGELRAASQSYEKNLGENVPPERARQALLKISELTLAQGNVAEAVQKLEAFLARHPEDGASEVVLLTLGELHLQAHLAGLETNRLEGLTNSFPAVTNHLQAALVDFERVITNFPQGALTGKAQLNKGWALWADGRIPQSQTAFKLAAELLPHAEEQAVARFKMAEAQFYQKNYTDALPVFRSVLADFSDLPRLKDGLFDQDLYQILRTSLKLGDLPSAQDAMTQLLRRYPGSFFNDRSMLLVGQHLTASQRPSEARLVFQELLQRSPASALEPQVELAIARTFVQENDWPAAIARYEAWLGRFATNDLQAQVEFSRAWANSQAGRSTNALSLFTNFVARFATNDLAPIAQAWVASFYYRQNDFVLAEKNFQDKILLANTNYSYQSLMNAGRAALARQAYADAKKFYFQPLVEDNTCPPDLKAEAYFALGDTLTLEAPDPARPLQKFDDAIVAFKKIPGLYPNNRLVPRALGRIGDCYLQMATVDSKQYDQATNAYQKVLLAGTAADVSARSQAEFGLALALEGMAKLKQGLENALFLDAAFAHYANVLYERNLAEGETADTFWVKKAGLAAARLAEERKQWEIASKIYNRLLIKLPPLRDFLAKQIERAAEQVPQEKN